MTAAPASAHTVGGGGPTNVTTTLGPLTPAVPGLSLRVIENGSRVELVNDSGKQVIVLGYNGEPYLRSDADGSTWDNLQSTATYYNTSRNGGAIPPGIDDKLGLIDWKQTGKTDTVRWHDHRTHYLSKILPPAVSANPNKSYVIDDYKITVQVDGVTSSAAGQLLWKPGSPSWPWWSVAGVLLVGCALLPRLRPWRAACAIAVGLLVAADVVHSVGIALVRQGDTGDRLSAFAVSNWVDVVAWIAGLAACLLLLRNKFVPGLYLAAGTGAIIAIIGGLGNSATLEKSTAPFEWSIDLARIVTTLSLGLGFGAVVMAALALRRHDLPVAQPSTASAAAIQASSINDRSASS